MPTDAPTPPPADDDKARITRIWNRYHGQMEALDFNDADVRAQLALDLGILLGLATRLLQERGDG